ncbi:MAG: aldehyde dehydrogenase family protein [Myxococcota bacterium]|nr:aldehyde dehydrogenase family protein [Myxococcota bacterium]
MKRTEVTEMLAPYLPEDSTNKHLSDALMRLSRGRDGWVRTTVQERIDLLNVCLTGLELEAADWVASACRARRYPLGGPEEGEEWLTGPVALLRYIRLLIHALEFGGEPLLPGSHQRSDGQWVADVFPAEPRERTLMPGVSGEVWLEPGASIAQGGRYRAGAPDHGQICLVLGGGGVTSAAAIDALHQLFIEDRVVLLKLSPLDVSVGPFIARMFWKLIELNYFTVVFGGEDVGATLAASPAVDVVCLTGTAQTAAALSEAGVTVSYAAVGGVNPVIVCPGSWSEDELDHQARQVATMITQGGGASCAAAQVLLMPSGWPQRAAFIDALESALSELPCRPPVSPRSEDAHRDLQLRYPQARQFGAGVGLPWMLIPDVPAHDGEPLLSTEYPVGVAGLVDVVAGSLEDFLAAAVRLCNTTLAGDVCATILVSGESQGSNHSTIERAISALEYGTVGLNIWPGVAMGLGVSPWGSPGSTLRNTFLLERVQKAVFRAPSHLRTTPIWFSDRPGIARMGPALASFTSAPRWRKVPRLLLASTPALLPWRR